MKSSHPLLAFTMRISEAMDSDYQKPSKGLVAASLSLIESLFCVCSGSSDCLSASQLVHILPTTTERRAQ